jgi:hypothetical protein
MSYEIQTTTNLGGDQITVLHRTSDGAIIPADSGNTDYQEYLDWVADGNTAATWSPTVTDPPEPTPDSEVMFTMEVI